MPPKTKLESDSENGDILIKMMDMFEKCTSRIIEQMNANFVKQSEMLSCEMFEMKTKVDLLSQENDKLKKENKELKKDQNELYGKLRSIEERFEDHEQEKLKDEIVITGTFQIEPLNPANIASFLHKTCETSVQPSSITNFVSFKNKTGQTSIKLSVSNGAERLSLLRNKKAAANKKVFINESLTVQRYKLLMTAKSFCKSNQLLAAWTKNGNVLVRKSDSDKVLYIKNQFHLQEIVA